MGLDGASPVADSQRPIASAGTTGARRECTVLMISAASITPGARLARRARPPKDADAEYVTNPAAGFSMAFDRFGTVAATPYIPTDQRLEGPQGVTFRTPELERPLRLIGPLALRLRAASSATDTDWHAKLADVAPDGSESLITDGALRASHREVDRSKSRRARPYHPHTDPEPLEPGRFYDFDIEIWPTAYELQPGHRLQLRLTSTDLPTHLPGTPYLDQDNPQDTRVDLNPPAINTVRLARSWLTVPVPRTGKRHRGG